MPRISSAIALNVQPDLATVGSRISPELKEVGARILNKTGKTWRDLIEAAIIVYAAELSQKTGAGRPHRMFPGNEPRHKLRLVPHAA